MLAAVWLNLETESNARKRVQYETRPSQTCHTSAGIRWLQFHAGLAESTFCEQRASLALYKQGDIPLHAAVHIPLAKG
jgi:hypothetical protein